MCNFFIFRSLRCDSIVNMDKRNLWDETPTTLTEFGPLSSDVKPAGNFFSRWLRKGKGEWFTCVSRLCKFNFKLKQQHIFKLNNNENAYMCTVCFQCCGTIYYCVIVLSKCIVLCTYIHCCFSLFVFAHLELLLFWWDQCAI